MSKPKIDRFKQNLRNGVIQFRYKKKSTGEMRDAVGTLDKRILPTDLRTWKRKTQRRVPANSVIYYDMNKKQIRSFKTYLLDKILKRLNYAQFKAKQQNKPVDQKEEQVQSKED